MDEITAVNGQLYGALNGFDEGKGITRLRFFAALLRRQQGETNTQDEPSHQKVTTEPSDTGQPRSLTPPSGCRTNDGRAPALARREWRCGVLQRRRSVPDRRLAHCWAATCVTESRRSAGPPMQDMARVITGEHPSTESRKLSPGDASQDQEFCLARAERTSGQQYVGPVSRAPKEVSPIR